MSNAVAAPYKVVIGLEVHVQLLTQSKLFCGCSTKFGLPANSSTCPVCLGMPGALPVMNQRAFELSLKAALALNCEIADFTKWDRKNYYYPDLPKNFQISQYDLPFSSNGFLEIEMPGGTKRVGIIRAHLEEDAGKSLHDESGSGQDSRVDLNRAGTPLLEIVSQPELDSGEEARLYLEELRLLLKELGISDCEMQEGSLRCDANINLHISQPDGAVAATPIVEVKNLNSFRAVERAMKYEADRQYEQFQKDGKKLGEVAKATAGWDEARGVTLVQRRKEEASDYRYFPEPDLVPVRVSPETLSQARANLGELPSACRARLEKDFGLGRYDASVLTKLGKDLVQYYEATARKSKDPKAVCNWVTNQVLNTLNEKSLNIGEFPLPAEILAGLVNEVQETGLNMQRAREVYTRMLETREDARQAIEKLGFKVVGDVGQITEIVRKAIGANPKAVADFKKGKTKAADAIKGAVMRETKGMAKMEVVQEIVMAELAKTPEVS
ncbi:MAG: Asp-tRNA(Asn)/Glu-tRNA(Gln) amidotransferase subunit GatB [Gemmataceae bacterium]|nr:Asp-tRNA(Asn)/Glu-tRNA(Gln) amidotransferase subunit GatB [Gemmataceae bacterium]